MEYKDTIFLPKTSFEMRANLPKKEPKILEEWDKQNIYLQLRKKSKGRGKNLFFMMVHLMQMVIFIWELL